MLAGIAGVLLGMFLGVSSYSVGPLTASAFSIVVLGGLGSVSGSLIAAYVVGYLETHDRLSRLARLSDDPGAFAPRLRHVCAPARPPRTALGVMRSRFRKAQNKAALSGRVSANRRGARRSHRFAIGGSLSRRRAHDLSRASPPVTSTTRLSM